MSTPTPRGRIYRCPVCGAEVAVLSPQRGDFRPRCCDVDMVPSDRRLVFFVCPKCGAEIGTILPNPAAFAPRCCDTPMQRLPA